MQKAISRRRFLKQATLAGGAALLAGTTGAAKPSGRGDGGAPRPYRPSRAEVAEAFRRQANYGQVTRQPIFKMRIEPHWFGDNTRFWYRNALAQGRREFILADAARGVRAPPSTTRGWRPRCLMPPGTLMKVSGCRLTPSNSQTTLRPSGLRRTALPGRVT